jgi:hypothetical protein
MFSKFVLAFLNLTSVQSTQNGIGPTETVIQDLCRDREPNGIFQDKKMNELQRDSIIVAIAQEIAASQELPQQAWLEIDGIEHLHNSQGKFVYRISLSSYVNFQPDQPLTFADRDTGQKISAVVLICDDRGLVIETEHALTEQLRLMQVSFDPTFILKALRKVFERNDDTPILQSLLQKSFPEISKPKPEHIPGLNEEQCDAVSKMTSSSIHLLWGPPGTGKTTTLGAAVAKWLRLGKSVLIVSTSNAAVDVAMRAVWERIQAKERKFVLRLGTSLDPKVDNITLGAKLANHDYTSGSAANEAQKQLRLITKDLAQHTLSNERYQELWAEKCRLDSIVHQFNQKAEAFLPEALGDAKVVGCTLAKMVLEKELSERHFDFVVVDEASMVSLVFAVAASKLAKSHLIYAGDPKQLPPICQSLATEARKWFGQNIYDFFGFYVADNSIHENGAVSELHTQYRMTDSIGGLVSRLSYNDKLIHGRAVVGHAVQFVEIPAEWQRTYYSVAEKSYYHPAIIPIVHRLAKGMEQEAGSLLLLSPFRPQKSILTAIGYDISKKLPKMTVLASTIHRSQGAEANFVIVDLTTHSSEQIVSFFRDQHAAHLFNVAISRAKDRLVLVGSLAVVEALSSIDLFWQQVRKQLRTNASIISGDELFRETKTIDELKLQATDKPERQRIPGIYSHDPRNGAIGPIVEVFRASGSKRKLVVLPDETHSVDFAGDCVVRHSSNSPPLLSAAGVVCLPLNGRWVRTLSRNVASVLWRIGFSHLADDEIDPMQAARFFCPDCANGNLVLKRIVGEGWFLTCTNAQVHECIYRRRLSLEDAKLKVRLSAMTCPSGHPLTARTKGNDYFLGCENYPHCEYTTPLSLIAGL